MKRILLLFLVMACGMSAFGQRKKDFQKSADEAFAAHNYYQALTYYNNVLEFDDKDVNALTQSAHAARLFNAYDVAAQKYSYLIDSMQIETDSLNIFYLGQMHQQMGHYDKALQYYQMYTNKYGNTEDYYTKLALSNIEAVKWASGRVSNIDPNVTISKMDAVNSNHSDFAAQKNGEVLYFSSHRFDQKSPIVHPPHKVSKLMSYSEAQAAMPIKAGMNETDLSVANATFSPDGTKIYYTVCEFVNENDLRCDLYVADVKADGEYGTGTMLASPINLPNVTTTQPSIVKDAKNNQEILYFVSDRPGGKGKLDLWYSVLDPKLGFSTPMNLSTLNTAENEATPFFHSPTNTLYFSSDGKLGLGGYDIYSSVKVNDNFQTAESLDAPYNSSYHDMYFSLSADGKEGFFSSNREGSNYVDNLLKSCCFDIYKADITPLLLNLNALTFNKATNEKLNGVKVKLIDQSTGLVVAEIDPADTNEHLFKLEKGKDYLIVAEKEGFMPDQITYSTKNAKSPEDIIKKLYLQPSTVDLDVFTFEDPSKQNLNGVTVTLEDITDPNNPKKVLTNANANDFHFAVSTNKKYRITAFKPGYSTEVVEIDTKNASGKISKNIFLHKFDADRLLPISLYFDNDQPEPRSKSTVTNQAFKDLLGRYMVRKGEFIENYTNGVNGTEKEESKANMENFFEGEVRGGYDKFNHFVDELFKELAAGQKIEIMIKGFASPRFDSKYNLVLGQRRVNSILNDLRNYKNGAITTYLNSGQLILTEVSYGEELAPKDVDDNVNDRKGSIYSLKASRERRVEIVNVKSKF